ncbi:glycosyltransferase [Microbacterium sp. CCNWLW134]|uniref:glycosyltransferase n=1 Tax=Microbacterium sp. CCNWLW134 TaxID=3122064 RepID=UPI00300FAB05
MNVLVLSTSLHGGGAEYVARTWAKGLEDRGYTVVVATTAGKGSERNPEDPMRRAYSLGGRGLLQTVVRLRKLIRKNQFDVVVSLQTFPNLAAILSSFAFPAARRPRVFVSERNLVSLGLPGSSITHKSKIWLARKLYSQAYGVIAISHPVAAELVSWFGVRGERCTVVPNPATAKVAGIQRPIMRPVDLTAPITLVMPARQVTQKQPWLAIQAARELMDRGYLVSVVAYGAGPLSRSTASLAEELGVPYRAAGWVEDWCADLPANSVVVLTSRREGFGNVLVECAAVGVPAVALSSALGVADAIVPGVTGYFALRGHAESVADAVEECSHLQELDITPWLRRFTSGKSLDFLEEVLTVR